ncbi:hypothetical protein H696_03174 [Fonticula alba]|uniref:Uncharacterized protein n=1 Tax=Fonticula alba TaxID=691883 RepID=A0A058ZBL3_FONAL|nr:hypothetical protein H696_03174 [Fonticula alba]KCV70817.1 hypothetical protein H696_03174 [Fonticula alba]|eukprot:XP_009495333.1 hypothetical protein H696_03174 [Fonticula alba]
MDPVRSPTPEEDAPPSASAVVNLNGNSSECFLDPATAQPPASGSNLGMTFSEFDSAAQAAPPLPMMGLHPQPPPQVSSNGWGLAWAANNLWRSVLMRLVKRGLGMWIDFTDEKNNYGVVVGVDFLRIDGELRHITLNQARINALLRQPEAVGESGFCFQIISSGVDKISLKVPWRSFFSDTFFAGMENAHVTLVMVPVRDLVKPAALSSAAPPAPGTDDPAEMITSGVSILGWLLDRTLNNLQICLSDLELSVHLCHAMTLAQIEAASAVGSLSAFSPLARAGVRLDRFSAGRTGGEPQTDADPPAEPAQGPQFRPFCQLTTHLNGVSVWLDDIAVGQPGVPRGPAAGGSPSPEGRAADSADADAERPLVWVDPLRPTSTPEHIWPFDPLVSPVPSISMSLCLARSAASLGAEQAGFFPLLSQRAPSFEVGFDLKVGPVRSYVGLRQLAILSRFSRLADAAAATATCACQESAHQSAACRRCFQSGPVAAGGFLRSFIAPPPGGDPLHQQPPGLNSLMSLLYMAPSVRSSIALNSVSIDPSRLMSLYNASSFMAGSAMSSMHGLGTVGDLGQSSFMPVHPQDSDMGTHAPPGGGAPSAFSFDQAFSLRPVFESSSGRRQATIRRMLRNEFHRIRGQSQKASPKQRPGRASRQSTNLDALSSAVHRASLAAGPGDELAGPDSPGPLTAPARGNEAGCAAGVVPEPGHASTPGSRAPSPPDTGPDDSTDEEDDDYDEVFYDALSSLSLTSESLAHLLSSSPTAGTPSADLPEGDLLFEGDLLSDQPESMSLFNELSNLFLVPVGCIRFLMNATFDSVSLHLDISQAGAGLAARDRLSVRLDQGFTFRMNSHASPSAGLMATVRRTLAASQPTLTAATIRTPIFLDPGDPAGDGASAPGPGADPATGPEPPQTPDDPHGHFVYSMRLALLGEMSLTERRSTDCRILAIEPRVSTLAGAPAEVLTLAVEHAGRDLCERLAPAEGDASLPDGLLGIFAAVPGHLSLDLDPFLPDRLLPALALLGPGPGELADEAAPPGGGGGAAAAPRTQPPVVSPAEPPQRRMMVGLLDLPHPVHVNIAVPDSRRVAADKAAGPRADPRPRPYLRPDVQILLVLGQTRVAFGRRLHCCEPVPSRLGACPVTGGSNASAGAPAPSSAGAPHAGPHAATGGPHLPGLGGHVPAPGAGCAAGRATCPLYLEAGCGDFLVFLVAPGVHYPARAGSDLSAFPPVFHSRSLEARVRIGPVADPALAHASRPALLTAFRVPPVQLGDPAGGLATNSGPGGPAAAGTAPGVPGSSGLSPGERSASPSGRSPDLRGSSSATGAPGPGGVPGTEAGQSAAGGPAPPRRGSPSLATLARTRVHLELAFGDSSVGCRVLAAAPCLARSPTPSSVYLLNPTLPVCGLALAAVCYDELSSFLPTELIWRPCPKEAGLQPGPAGLQASLAGPSAEGGNAPPAGGSNSLHDLVIVVSLDSLSIHVPLSFDTPSGAAARNAGPTATAPGPSSRPACLPPLCAALCRGVCSETAAGPGLNRYGQPPAETLHIVLGRFRVIRINGVRGSPGVNQAHLTIGHAFVNILSTGAPGLRTASLSPETLAALPTHPTARAQAYCLLYRALSPSLISSHLARPVAELSTTVPSASAAQLSEMFNLSPLIDARLTYHLVESATPVTGELPSPGGPAGRPAWNVSTVSGARRFFVYIKPVVLRLPPEDLFAPIGRAISTFGTVSDGFHGGGPFCRGYSPLAGETAFDLKLRFSDFLIMATPCSAPFVVALCPPISSGYGRTQAGHGDGKAGPVTGPGSTAGHGGHHVGGPDKFDPTPAAGYSIGGLLRPGQNSNDTLSGHLYNGLLVDISSLGEPSIRQACFPHPAVVLHQDFGSPADPSVSPGGRPVSPGPAGGGPASTTPVMAIPPSAGGPGGASTPGAWPADHQQPTFSLCISAPAGAELFAIPHWRLLHSHVASAGADLPFDRLAYSEHPEAAWPLYQPPSLLEPLLSPRHVERFWRRLVEELFKNGRKWTRIPTNPTGAVSDYLLGQNLSRVASVSYGSYSVTHPAGITQKNMEVDFGQLRFDLSADTMQLAMFVMDYYFGEEGGSNGKADAPGRGPEPGPATSPGPGASAAGSEAATPMAHVSPRLDLLRPSGDLLEGVIEGDFAGTWLTPAMPAPLHAVASPPGNHVPRNDSQLYPTRRLIIMLDALELRIHNGLQFPSFIGPYSRLASSLVEDTHPAGLPGRLHPPGPAAGPGLRARGSLPPTTPFSSPDAAVQAGLTPASCSVVNEQLVVRFRGLRVDWLDYDPEDVPVGELADPPGTQSHARLVLHEILVYGNIGMQSTAQSGGLVTQTPHVFYLGSDQSAQSIPQMGPGGQGGEDPAGAGPPSAWGSSHGAPTGEPLRSVAELDFRIVRPRPLTEPLNTERRVEVFMRPLSVYIDADAVDFLASLSMFLSLSATTPPTPGFSEAHDPPGGAHPPAGRRSPPAGRLSVDTGRSPGTGPPGGSSSASTSPLDPSLEAWLDILAESPVLAAVVSAAAASSSGQAPSRPGAPGAGEPSSGSPGTARGSPSAPYFYQYVHIHPLQVRIRNERKTLHYRDLLRKPSSLATILRLVPLDSTLLTFFDPTMSLSESPSAPAPGDYSLSTPGAGAESGAAAGLVLRGVSSTAALLRQVVRELSKKQLAYGFALLYGVARGAMSAATSTGRRAVSMAPELLQGILPLLTLQRARDLLFPRPLLASPPTGPGSRGSSQPAPSSDDDFELIEGE